VSASLPAETPARVLVATSDALSRELLASAVSRPGVELLLASDGVEALGRAREGTLDLLIVDAFLSVVDGVTLCTRVRASSLSRQPSVVIAGVATQRAVDLALQAGADDVIRKPFQASLIRHRMEVLLAERATGTRLALLERAVDAATSGITLLDARSPEYPALFVNRTFAEMTGYAREELVGHNLRMLAGPETDVLALQAMRDALTEGRECRTVIKNYRKDGSTFWNELSLAPVRDTDGRLTHFVGIQTDASLRVRVGELALAQQELEELVAQRTRELAEALGGLERRRRFTDTVLNALAAGVVTTDRAGRVSFVNRAAQELLRLSLADCLGKPVLEVLGADPALQAALQKTAAREARGVECQVGASGGARFVAGLTIVHASGEAGDELGHILLFRELLGGRPYAGRATGATGAEAVAHAGAAPGAAEPAALGPEPVTVTAADADAESQALPTPPARPRAVAPLTLLQEALAQLAGAGEVRHPVIENPFQATPQVWVDPGTAAEALRLLLETGHTLVVPPGRVRVRVRYEARAGLATHDLRLELAPDGAAAEQAPRSPWPHTVDLNLDRAQQLLMSQAGRLEVARDEDGRWVLSAFLPRELPAPRTT